MRGFSFEEVVMATAYISPRFAAIDAYGNPLVGGRLYTYANTTTTPQTTYQDADGTIANTNPIILDARGEAVIFLQSGLTYTFVLKTATDALIWTQDSIVGEGSGTGEITVVNALPSSDIGVIYLAGQGTFYWDGTGYVSDFQNGFGSGAFGFKNRIINGDFRRSIRGTTIGPVVSGSGIVYLADRWKAVAQGTASLTYTQQVAGTDYAQNRVGPFTMRLTSNAAASPGANDVVRLAQSLTGYQCADFAMGSTWSGNITLSFWVKSSIAGQFSVAFTNGATTRSYVSTYTVNVAGAWEYKTISLPCDSSGLANWSRTETVGLNVLFDLGSGSASEGVANTWLSGNFSRVTGSVRISGTSGATFEIGRVQLERGDKSTPFETIDDALLQSQCDFFYKVLPSVTILGDSSVVGQSFCVPVTFARMRATPTAQYGTVSYSNAANAIAFSIGNGVVNVSANSVTTGPCGVTITSITLNSEI